MAIERPRFGTVEQVAVEPGVETRIVTRLAADLESGRWDEGNADLRGQQSYEGSLRLVISDPA